MPYCDKYTSNNNKKSYNMSNHLKHPKRITFFKLFTKTQILIELINAIHENWWNTNSRNQPLEIQKSQKGRPITNGSMKTHQHVHHKRNDIPWLLTINFKPKLHKRPAYHGSLPHQFWVETPQTGFNPHTNKETLHIASLNHKMIIIDQ